MNEQTPTPYNLVDRIHDRATFVAELLKFYPHTPTEKDLTGMWAILADIAADAKRALELLDVAGNGREQVIDLDQMGGHGPAKA